MKLLLALLICAQVPLDIPEDIQQGAFLYPSPVMGAINRVALQAQEELDAHGSDMSIASQLEIAVRQEIFEQTALQTQTDLFCQIEAAADQYAVYRIRPRPPNMYDYSAHVHGVVEGEFKLLSKRTFASNRLILDLSEMKAIFAESQEQVMSAKYAVVTGLLGDVASETKDFTKADFGDVTGAIIISSNANGINNPEVNFQFNIAFWDGTNLRSSSIYSQSAVGTSASAKAMSASTIDCKFSTTAYFAQYTVSAISNGIRITMSYDNTGAERLATVILFGGTVVANVGTVTPHGTQNSTASVTGLAYRPDVVLFAGCGAASGANNAAGMLSFGVVVDDGSLTQRAQLIGSVDSVGTSVTNRRIETNSVGGQLYNDALTWTGEITAINADGFTVTTRDGASGGDDLFYMALNLDGDDAFLATLTTPTSTGNDAITGVGWTPELALLSGIGVAADIDAVGANSQMMVGASDGATSRVIVARDEDNQDTTDASSLSADTLLTALSSSDGSVTVVGDFVSFDADGRTYNYTTVLGVAIYGWELLFGTPPSSGNPWYSYAQQ